MSLKEKISALQSVSEMLTQLQSLGEDALAELPRRMNYVREVLKVKNLLDVDDFVRLIRNPPVASWPGSKSAEPTVWLNPTTWIDEMIEREKTMWRRFGIKLGRDWEIKGYRKYLEGVGFLKMCYLRSWGYDVCIFPKLRVTLEPPHWDYQDILPIDLRYVNMVDQKWHDADRDDEKRCVFLLRYSRICIVETGAIPETPEAPLNDLLAEAFRRGGHEYPFSPERGMIQACDAFPDITNKLMYALRGFGVPGYHSTLERYVESMILDNYPADWPRVKRKTSQVPVWLGQERNVSQLALANGELTDHYGHQPMIEEAFGRIILNMEIGHVN